MDFGKLLAGNDAARPLDPRDIYASLPEKAVGYGYLRDVQGQVLSKWHARRAQRDSVIKVNTGGGKTIDGLLILRSLLNEKLGPGLYVAPDKYLVQQVIEEADRLGLKTTEEPETAQYLSSEAIGVVNASRLMNGRSIFSNSRPSKAPVPVKSVVIDDVHAALATISASMSITLKLNDPVAVELFELFEENLREQSPNDVLDVRDRSLSALARVPFWAWRAKLEKARELLHKARDSADLRFTWPAVSPVLELCQVVFTGRDVSIVPPCPPVQHITGFHEALRRVYLTATLSDDSLLVRDLEADPESVLNPITPSSAGDIGERMILAPQEINPEVSGPEARDAIASLARQNNVVVLVPSDRAAGNWTPYSARVVHADQVASVVSQLRSGHIGLVVLVNKYDGIDLPGDACRVLVLDGLPEVSSGEERVEAMLRRYEGADDRQVQRIEQGMGRGVRSNEDHCVVFLLGSRLSQLVADPRSLVRFGPATQAQLDLSRSVAGNLQGSSMREILDVAGQALSRDPSWVALAKQTISSVPAARATVRSSAIAERRAFDLAVNRDYVGATETLSVAINDVDDAEGGLLMERQALYYDQLDPERAQVVLAAARARNAYVLRPIAGVTYKRLSLIGTQAQRAAKFLSSYSTGPELRLAFEGLVEDLAFDPARTSEHEMALASTGRHLGLEAERPEKELGHGPDVLWALGEMNFWIIEAKSGARTDTIKKTDANQLAGSMHWFREKYDGSGHAVPVMVHRAHKLAPDAYSTPGMQVLTEEGAGRLKTSLSAFATGLAAQGRWDEPAVIESLLRGHSLRVADLSRYLHNVGKK